MGQEFAFIFDITVVAILIGLTFAGAKKGFAKVILEMSALLISVFCAFTLSEPLAGQIYSGVVEKPAEEFLDSKAEEFDDFLNVDYFGGAELALEKVKIDGISSTAIEPDFEGTNTAIIDLTNKTVDLSETGLQETDLSFFGIEKGSDLSAVSIKTVEFSVEDEKKYGVGTIIAAHYIAACSVNSGAAEPVGNLLNELSKFLPSEFISGTSGVTVSTIRGVVLAMLETKQTAKSAIMSGIIEPYCTVIIRTILFMAIFILAMVVLNLIIRFAGLINKIPVLGQANKLLGGVAGFCEGAAVILVVCVITRLIVSIGGDSAILFNEASIDKTFLFKHIYSFDFISF